LTEKQVKGRDFCRSLYIAEDMKAGDVFTEINLRSVRPGFGLHPKYYCEVIGKKASEDVSKGTPMRLDFLLEQ
jgi:pseudaminic acid synthase